MQLLLLYRSQVHEIMGELQFAIADAERSFEIAQRLLLITVEALQERLRELRCQLAILITTSRT